MIKRAILLFAFCFFWLSAARLWAQVSPRSFWTALSPSEYKVMAKLVRHYNSEHSYHPVILKNISSPALLFHLLKTGKSPDLALINSQWIGSLSSKLLPADTILKKAGAAVEVMVESDTFRPIWESCVFNKQAWIIPFSAETAALVLNKKSFRPSAQISTLSQWSNLVKKTEPGEKTEGIVLPFEWSSSDLGQFWEDFSKTFSAENSTFFHQKLATLNVWWNWVNRYHLTTLHPYSIPLDFKRGKSWILLPNETASLKNEFLVKPLPEAGKLWGYLQVQGIAFFGKKGWDFANYITDYRQLKFWAVKTNTVPVNKQVYLSPDYLQNVRLKRPWMKVYIQEISRSSPPLNSPHAVSELKTIAEIVKSTLRKQITETKAVQKIQKLMSESDRTK